MSRGKTLRKKNRIIVKKYITPEELMKEVFSKASDRLRAALIESSYNENLDVDAWLSFESLDDFAEKG